MQFKALDNVLQTVNRDTGQKEALSYRCADIDRWVLGLPLSFSREQRGVGRLEGGAHLPLRTHRLSGKCSCHAVMP